MLGWDGVPVTQADQAVIPFQRREQLLQFAGAGVEADLQVEAAGDRAQFDRVVLLLRRTVEFALHSVVQFADHAHHGSGALDEVGRDVAPRPTAQPGGRGPVVIRVADGRAQEERRVLAHRAHHVAKGQAIDRHVHKTSKDVPWRA